MRVRLETLHLTGTHRTVEFSPGLNIITGPITTGKTTLINMCRAVFGSHIWHSIIEAKKVVSALSARILIGDNGYQVSRPFVTTDTAMIDIAGDDGTASRLPSSVPVIGTNLTYGQWLLQKLSLPVLKVPLAPTKPDSTPTSLSVNDYFQYCSLSQWEIDNSVFGNHDVFRNNKRKYIFGVLYGLYSPEMAEIQTALRLVSAKIDSISNQDEAFELVLKGTPWENRAALELEQHKRESELISLESDLQNISKEKVAPHLTELRIQVRQIEMKYSETQASIQAENNWKEELKHLASQLEFQVSKMTRSIVAGDLFSDIEFVVCPRCGTNLDQSRTNNDKCVLCLQTPTVRYDRDSLISEQERLTRQILETQYLISERELSIKTLQRELNASEIQRERLSHELELQSTSFVSDRMSQIATIERERARSSSDIQRVSDYLSLFSRLDNLRQSLSSLRLSQKELEARLDVLSVKGEESERKIRLLEYNFRGLLDRFHVPKFGQVGETRIDRETYLPVVHGRQFDNLSSQGLKVIVNVAHALAHQITAIELDIPLPNILFIDGLTSNVSREDGDMERVQSIYEYLAELSGKYGDRLQIIVADQDVPSSGSQFIKLHLHDSDRLIPELDLTK